MPSTLCTQVTQVPMDAGASRLGDLNIWSWRIVDERQQVRARGSESTREAAERAARRFLELLEASVDS
jgi:hypothetical protein